MWPTGHTHTHKVFNPFKIAGATFRGTLESMGKVAENPLEVMRPSNWVRPMLDGAEAGLEYQQDWSEHSAVGSRSGPTDQAQKTTKQVLDELGAKFPRLARNHGYDLRRVLNRSSRARAVLASALGHVSENPTVGAKLVPRIVESLANGKRASVAKDFATQLFKTTFSMLAPSGGPRPTRNASQVANTIGGESNPDIAKTKAYLDQRTVVLVAGFGGEATMKDYFSPMTDVLGALGQPATKIGPPSLEDCETNADALVADLLHQYYAGGRKPLTIIGHSKGGIESLLAVLRHPELADLDIVGDIVCVQSPLQGTPAADRLLSLATSPATMMVPPAMVGGAMVATGIESLTPKVRNQQTQSALRRLNPTQRQLISDRTRYVRTSGASLEGTASQILANAISGPNDGLVPRSSQTVNGLGSEIQISDKPANHNDLVFDDKHSSWSTEDKHKAAFQILSSLAN